MTDARARGRHGSLGDSWATADYLDDNASVGSIDSAPDTERQRDYFEETGRDVLDEDDEDNMTTPMPQSRSTRSPQDYHDSPTKHPAARASGRAQVPRKGSRLYQQPPPQQSLEPAFIMPSLNASADEFTNASNLRNFRLKSRNQRPTSHNPKRRPKMRAVSPSTSDRRSDGRPFPSKSKQEVDADPTYLLSLLWQNLIRPVLGYVFDIFKLGMDGLKPLFGFAVPIVVLVILFNVGSTFVRQSFHNAATSLCAIPFAHHVLPFCDTITPIPSDRKADFDQLVSLQNTFENIVKDNHDSYSLPAKMVTSRLTMRDLKTQVEASTLPSKAELMNELENFVILSRETSDKISKYSSSLGAVADKIITTNHMTLKILQEIDATASPQSQTLSHINPFAIFFSPPDTIQQRIFARYVYHISEIKDDISALLVVSSSLEHLLDLLDTQLENIFAIGLRDDKRLNRDREELLSLFWTRLGGNRGPKATNTASLELIQSVISYRNRAMELVHSTNLRLKEISYGLENLRDGVARPEIMGYSEDHPLEWHIDIVGKSVERLRIARGEAKVVEADEIKKGLALLDNVGKPEQVGGGRTLYLDKS